MKKQFLNISLILLIASFMLASCTKDEGAYLGVIKVQISAPTDFPNQSVSGLEVTLLNTSDNTTRKATTDANGLVTFNNTPVGVYNINTSIKLSLSLTLNGVAQNVALTPNEIKLVNVPLIGVPASDGFVIKEIFFAGKQDYSQTDRFFEIYNNSNKTLYADNLYFADLAGYTGSNVNDAVLNLPLDQYYYAMRVAKIPGTGTTYPVQAGKSIVIAFNAMNFKEGFNPTNWAKLTIEDYLDLSKADFEMYAFPFLETKGFTGNATFDIDNPSVPNVDILYMYNAANNAFFRLNDYGPGLIIFKPEGQFSTTDVIESPLSTATNKLYFLKIPVSSVIDGVDVLDNSGASKYKRMTNIVDAGFTYLKPDGKAFYSNMSIRRKVERTDGDRKVLKDTNNSTNDFEAISRPTPRTI